MKKLISLMMVSILMIGLLAACAAPAAPAEPATSDDGGKVKVFGAFATPIEEPWDGVIHAALLKPRKMARSIIPIRIISVTQAIWNASSPRSPPSKKPDAIFGDAFGNEEAVRRVAAQFPEIAFVFGSGFGPSEPNLAVFDNWIHEPAYLSG